MERGRVFRGVVDRLRILRGRLQRVLHTGGQRQPAHPGARAQIAGSLLYQAPVRNKMTFALSCQTWIVGIGIVFHQCQVGAFHLHLALIVERGNLTVNQEQRRLCKTRHAAKAKGCFASLRRAPSDAAFGDSAIHVQPALGFYERARPL